MLLFFVNLYLHSRPRKNKPETVPVNFVAFLRASLAKMAGHGFLKPDLIDMEFWSKMHLRFSSVKFCDKSLVKKKKSYFIQGKHKISFSLSLCDTVRKHKNTLLLQAIE